MLNVVAETFLHRESTVEGPIVRVPMGAEYKALMYLAEAA
jgi:hypothetical protein